MMLNRKTIYINRWDQSVPRSTEFGRFIAWVLLPLQIRHVLASNADLLPDSAFESMSESSI